VDPAAGASFGRVYIESAKQISSIHLHLDEAHATGTMEAEVFRNRGQTFGASSAYGTMTRIATVSIAGGQSDGYTVGFTLLDADYAQLLPGDYLHFQPTQKPHGSAWAASVDVHYR